MGKQQLKEEQSMGKLLHWRQQWWKNERAKGRGPENLSRRHARAEHRERARSASEEVRRASQKPQKTGGSSNKQTYIRDPFAVKHPKMVYHHAAKKIVRPPSPHTKKNKDTSSKGSSQATKALVHPIPNRREEERTVRTQFQMAIEKTKLFRKQ